MASFFHLRRVARLLIAVSFCLVAAWSIWPELPVVPYSTIPGRNWNLRTAWSSDGRTFFGVQMVSNQPVTCIWQAWDVNTGRLRCRSEPTSISFNNLVFDPNDRVVIAADFTSKALMVWDAKTATKLKCVDLPSNLEENCDFQISSGGSTLAMFHPQRELSDVHLWSTPDLTPRAILKGQSSPLAFSSDGQLIATTQYADNTPTRINLWSASNGIKVQALDHNSTKMVASIHVGRSGFLAFTADDKRLGVAGSQEDKGDYKYINSTLTRFRVWDVATGSIANEYQGDVQFYFNARAATWEHIYTHRHGSAPTQQLLSQVTADETCLKFNATGTPKLPILQCFATTFGIHPCATRPYVAINEYVGHNNQPKPLKYISSIVDHVLRYLGMIKSSYTRGQIQMMEVGREEPLFVLNGQRFLSFSHDGKFFATDAFDKEVTHIYRMMPDRPWWLLVACSLSFLVAVELGWWIVSLAARLVF